MLPIRVDLDGMTEFAFRRVAHALHDGRTLSFISRKRDDFNGVPVIHFQQNLSGCSLATIVHN